MQNQGCDAVLGIQLALSFDEDGGNGALTNHELDRPHVKSIYW